MSIIKNMSAEKKGTWFAVSSGLLYALIGYFGVTLMRSGISVFNLSVWRFLIASCVMAVILWSRGWQKLNWKMALSTLINGGVFYSGSCIFFFLATKYIGTGQSMVIFFVYPIWIMFFNWLLYGQPLRAHYLVSFVLISIGLVFLVDVQELSFDFLGISFSLLSSISYAIYLVWSKKLNLTPLDSTLTVSIGCALVALFLALFDGSLAVPMLFDQWLRLIIFAIFCTAVPILLMLEAMKYLSSEKASLLSVLEPLFTVVFGVLLLGETVYLNTLVGIILTLAGAMTVLVKWPNFVTSPFAYFRSLGNRDRA
jgi:drug/metabolite transporter (DMT)-like permease